MPRERADGVTPCLIYFHGGAFNTECSIQHFVVQRLAERLECKIVLPFYRLAPAYPFPFGFEDCYSTLQWVVRHAEGLKVDKNRIAVMGDSAGGNLSAAVCLRNRDENFAK